LSNIHIFYDKKNEYVKKIDITSLWSSYITGRRNIGHDCGLGPLGAFALRRLDKPRFRRSAGVFVVYFPSCFIETMERWKFRLTSRILDLPIVDCLFSTRKNVSQSAAWKCRITIMCTTQSYNVLCV